MKKSILAIIIFYNFSLWNFSFPKEESYSLFGFYLGDKLQHNMKHAREIGLSLKKKFKHHVLYEGPFYENSDIEMKIVMSFKESIVYDINLDLISKSKEILNPYYSEALELAENSLESVDPEALFEGLNFLYDMSYRKGDLVVTLGMFESDANTFVVSIKYRFQSLFIKYEIGKSYYFELANSKYYWRIAEKSFDIMPEMPRFVRGRKVFNMKDDEKLIYNEILLHHDPIFRGVEGNTVVIAVVDSQGQVFDVWVESSTSPIISKEAVEAIKQWICKPASLNGMPVYSWLKVTFRFRRG